MVTTLRVEDRLDGASSFGSWKTTVLNILEENEVDDYVNRVILEPTNDKGKAKHTKNESKEKMILIDSVKDHLIPHISQLNIAKKVYDALTSLFETNNPNKKKDLRNTIGDISMMKDDTIATSFMKIF